MTFLLDPNILRLAAAADARERRRDTLAQPPGRRSLAAEDYVLRATTILGELSNQVRTHPSDSRPLIHLAADLLLELLGVLEATEAIQFASLPLWAPAPDRPGLPREPGAPSST